ncbi:MAG: anthranilate synthase component I family protein [Candidatus Omnitrophica bacterium]|nr:anthranilate synthase component I family protein [Candidatus Omnitrophota bacterium]
MKKAVFPTRRQFKNWARLGRRIPVAVRLPLELDAQSIFEAMAFTASSALLESARPHPITGRYSILAGDPVEIFTARGREIERIFQTGSERFEADPLETLQELLDRRKAVSVPGLPPFVGGAVGYFSYDAVRLFEAIPAAAENDLPLPEIAFLFCDETVVLDHAEGWLWAIVTVDPSETPDSAYDSASARAEELLRRATRSAPWVASAGSGRTEEGSLRSTHTRASFETMVREAKRFIASGEIYQANLSQRFDVPLSETPWEMYRKLTRINPSPFSVYADFSIPGGGLQIVSASPERLLRLGGGWAETRPIAGTRPRGRSAVETARLRQELLFNEKERAEHLMLVDLERNDLGRICRYGSVRVDAFMGLEEYSHVIHIVSNVRGRLRPDAGFSQAVRALFPGGTITGCPKIRCMEIIERLEPVRRQLYTGSFGYISDGGGLDLNILIRTAVVRGGRLYFQAGAGIVADSDPSREYEETLHKAQAVLEILHEKVLV